MAIKTWSSSGKGKWARVACGCTEPLAQALGCPALVDSCRAHQGVHSPAIWQQTADIIAPHILGLLGPSRTTALSSTCPDWLQELRAVAAIARPQGKSGAGGSGPVGHAGCEDALLLALGAPGFGLGGRPLAEVEDYVYTACLGPQERQKSTDMLDARADICEHSDIHTMMCSLRAVCKVSEATVSVLFAPQVERDRTFYLTPRPLHFAIAASAVRLTRMLLGAATRAGSLDAILQKDGSDSVTLSPLFFAVLFGSAEVVHALHSAGSTINTVDVAKAGRLQHAGMWNSVEERLQELHLHEVAAELNAGLAESREKAAAWRAQMRSKLLGRTMRQPSEGVAI